jgi:hypothetical protein
MLLIARKVFNKGEYHADTNVWEICFSDCVGVAT